MGVVKIVRQGVKYAPVILPAIDKARGPVTDYARKRLDAARQRRVALAQAQSLTDGTVLPVVHGEEPVWVVFSGDTPIAQHPDTGMPLAGLVEHADLSRRRSPEDFPSTRKRASAAGHRAIHTLRRRRHRDSVADADAQLVGEGVGEVEQLEPAENRAAQAGQAERGHEPGAG
jgi:hypothetical protein